MGLFQIRSDAMVRSSTFCNVGGGIMPIADRLITGSILVRTFFLDTVNWVSGNGKNDTLEINKASLVEGSSDHFLSENGEG